MENITGPLRPLHCGGWGPANHDEQHYCFVFSSDHGSSDTVMLLYSGSWSHQGGADASIIMHLMFHSQGLHSLTQKKWAIPAIMNFSQWTLTQPPVPVLLWPFALVCLPVTLITPRLFHRYGREEQGRWRRPFLVHLVLLEHFLRPVSSFLCNRYVG